MALTLEGVLLKVKHRKLAVVLIPIAAGIFLTVILVVRPTAQKISRATFDQGELTRKADVMNNILIAEKQLAGYHKQLRSIEERSKLIESINVLAGKSQLTIASVTPEEKAPLGFYLEKITLRIDAEGNYHQLAGFISKIESLESAAKILSVDIDLESPENYALSSRSIGLNDNGSIKSGQLKSYKMSISIGFFASQKDML